MRFSLIRILFTGLLLASLGMNPAEHIFNPAALEYPIDLVPDQLALAGDVVTQSNCSDPTVCAWLAGTPPGSIILGVDPASGDPANWNGGTATAVIDLTAPFPKTRLLLEVSWPDRDEKGLHAGMKNSSGSIWLDGQLLWDKRTTEPGPNGQFFAARHEAVQTTIVLNASGTHSLRFQVPANTAWDISRISISASAAPSTYAGIGYSPYRDCQMPGGAVMPTTQDIQADLFRLANTTNVIRTYSSLGMNAQVPALAKQAGLVVFPGAWLDYPKTTMAQDEAEVQGLIQLACSNDVAGVIVGNEYYLRHRSSEALTYLGGRIQEVKDGIQSACGKTVPVTTAEIDDLAFSFQGNPPTTVTGIRADYRPVLDKLDFMMVHIYPFWSGMPIEGAASFTVSRYMAAQARLAQEYAGQNKWLIIGETGWPSGGAANGVAVASLFNQRKYMLEFLPLAEAQSVQFMYFDAFDELWKIEEPGGVGQRWGYAASDRSAKHSFYGVLIPGSALPEVGNDPTRRTYLPIVAGGPSGAVFTVFDEWPEGPGRFVPSGWMGDLNQIDVYGCDRSDPHSGEMAIRASFDATGPLGWGGVYWQYPENNWGNLPAGLNLSQANRVSFWAKGAQGGEKIRFFAGGIGTTADLYPDSIQPQVSSGFIQLTKSWQQYSINLVGKDLRHIVGGFGWATDRCANPGGAVFYLDDIRYDYQSGLLPPAHSSTLPIYSDAAAQTNHYTPSGWMGDATVEGRMTLSECWTGQPHSGSTSIRIAYTQAVIGWAGVVWTDPAENWGDRPGGLDLRGATQLTFWARSEPAGVPVQFVIGGVGYRESSDGSAICSSPKEPYPDSVCPKLTLNQTLNGEWTRYSISLAGRDLSRVVGGFGVVMKSPGVIFLDDIGYQ